MYIDLWKNEGTNGLPVYGLCVLYVSVIIYLNDCLGWIETVYMCYKMNVCLLLEQMAPRFVKVWMFENADAPSVCVFEF